MERLLPTDPFIMSMCEFKVFLSGEKVFEDVIYARAEGGAVMLRDVLGRTKTIHDARIVEVDVARELLVLEGS